MNDRDRRPDSLPAMPRPISGGSLREADLPAVPAMVSVGVAPSESPFSVGLRRLRKSATALAGVAIVSMAIDPTATSTLYAGAFGGVFKSTTGGQ